MALRTQPLTRRKKEKSSGAGKSAAGCRCRTEGARTRTGCGDARGPAPGCRRQRLQWHLARYPVVRVERERARLDTQARPFTFAGRPRLGDYDVPGYGSGGHETYSGSVDADGNVMITGSGQNSKVGKYPAQFSGKINGSSLDGTGRMGLRHCTFSYRRF